MKKPIALILLLALLLSTAFALAACNDDPPSPSPLPACNDDPPSPSPLPALRADGENILDSAGNIVVLRGTNFGGWLVQESWMCPTEQQDTLSVNMALYSRFGREKAEALIAAYEENWITEEDFAAVKALGLNTVRVPFTYMNAYYYLSDEGELLRPDEFTLREDPFERLDFALEMCVKYGLYLIIDLHGAVGSQNRNDHSGDTALTDLYADGELGEAYREKTAELWRLTAEHFAGKSNVAGYDLLNEPSRASGTEQWDLYDVLYRAVRSKDPDHMIFIESVWEPYNLPLPSDYGWENVVYEYHHYNWKGNDVPNSSFYSGKKKTADIFRHGVPVLIGEFNAWGDSRRSSGDSLQTDLEANAGVLEFYNGEGWHWTTWTYKAVGGYENNWGLYNASESEGDVTRVHPETDSYEDILAAWSATSTQEHFTLYDKFAEIVSAAAKAPFGEGAPEGGYSVI